MNHPCSIKLNKDDFLNKTARKFGYAIRLLYICVQILYVSNMDKNTLEFITYCISKLAHQLNLSQQDVYRRLKSSGILYDYMIPSYDVLHTFGSKYLMDDLISFMQEKGVLEK